MALSYDKSRLGNNIRLLSKAIKSVNAVNNPKAIVPPKSENTNMMNPKKSITAVYIILVLISFCTFAKASDMLEELVSSILYLVRKCIEKSTAIPNATLNTSTVLGLKLTPKNPIVPAVNNNGIRFGIMLITIIRMDLKILAINKDIIINAMSRLINKLLIK